MNPVPTAKEIMEFRAATGCGVNESKRYLQTWESVLIEKVLVAARNAGRLPTLESFSKVEPRLQEKILDASQQASDQFHLVDPIEIDPEIGPVISQIKSEEEAQFRGEYGNGWPRGGCHRIWKRTKERLADEHGIAWHSPAELNPSTAFD